MYFCGYVEGRISIQLSDEFIGFLKRRFEGRDGRTELYPLMSESLRMGKELREKGAQTICGTRLDPNSLKLQEILMPAVSCCKTDKGIAATFASSINGHGSICLIDASGKQLWKRQLEMHKSQRLGITSAPTDWYCASIFNYDEKALAILSATQSAIFLDIYDIRNGTSLMSTEFLHIPLSEK